MQVKDMKGLLKSLIHEMEKKLPYASAFVGSNEGRSVSVSSHEKTAGFVHPEKGITFTAFDGNVFHERSTNKLEEKEIRKIAFELIEECVKAGINTASELIIDPGEKLEKDFKVQMKIDPATLELQELLDKAEGYKNIVQSLSKKIVNCSVSFSNNHIEELFVNRNKVLYQEINRWTSFFYAVFQEGDKSSQIWGGDCKNGGAEFMGFEDEELKSKIADGERILSAERLKPGTYDCVFSPELSGMFAHEAFGHGTETDMYLKKRAKGEEFMGKIVAAENVNMYDSPALAHHASGSYFFDNEGQLAAETQIIKDGILVSGMTDLNSAMRLGYQRTPNGRRENYAHKVYARMTNTFFGTGNDEVEEMIKSIKHGYFVDYPTSGMEDPKGWGIQLEALYAREIVDGKLTDNYFTPVIVTGYVPDMLKSISMIGKKMEIAGLGMCGKGHKEWVKVTDGGPYLKLVARLA